MAEHGGEAAARLAEAAAAVGRLVRESGDRKAFATEAADGAAEAFGGLAEGAEWFGRVSREAMAELTSALRAAGADGEGEAERRAAAIAADGAENVRAIAESLAKAGEARYRAEAAVLGVLGALTGEDADEA